jgi:hypothetical protein
MSSDLKSVNSAFENADRLLQQVYRQSVSLYCATNIVKPTCVRISWKNTLNSLTNQRTPPKNYKTTRDTYIFRLWSNHTCQQYLNPSSQSFKCVPSAVFKIPILFIKALKAYLLLVIMRMHIQTSVSVALYCKIVRGGQDNFF